MPQNFSETLHLKRNAEDGSVKLSIATSENRVDEITLMESEIKPVMTALWERSSSYQGCSDVKAKYKEGRFSLSVQIGIRTRSVYRFDEGSIMPVIGQYMAETGGE
tara:strand:+ start:1260 stop:1577 length:318 start_codon:yes stop_codon:yes gene_type:complete